ncbi:unnamed protein product [Rhizophagus irregularis]|nr:unnamed protein product [Rhizophagus irregularis]
MSLNLFPRLSENLCSLLEYAEDYDVIIRVGGGSNNNSSNSGKNTCNRYIRQLEFQAHSLILRARSEYFRTALSSKWARKEGETFIFEKPNISPTVFEVILRYIYSGRIGLEKLGEGDIVKFWQLSLEDFNSKVRPYAEILPRNLKLKLLRHFSSTKSSNNNTNSNSGSASLNINTGLVTPGTSPTEVSPILSSNDLILSLHNITKKSASYSNSLTVSPPQAALIACWIDRKNVKDFTPLTSIPYIFRLLFRGSRDGFSAKTFHDKCDGRGATIVVVRVSGTKELIGGYNPIGWSSPRDVEWRGTRDSFIFSLSNSHSDSSNNVSTPKSKISRIKKDCVNEAIQLQDKLGPSFGFYELKIIDDAHEGSSSYASGGLKYEHSIRDKFNYFQVDDYEVFQVLKK